MPNRLKLGVIGVGSLGFHHARILREIDAVELVGIHDLDKERAAEVAASLDVKAFDGTDDLLSRLDACVIAVPTESHEAVAIRALSRGVSLMIEKPIAPDLAAADRILAAARSANVVIQVGHVERFNGALRACEEYLEEPLFVECHRLAPFGVRGTDVAVVLDLMIHDLDLVLSLMRRPVASVAAVGVSVLTSSPDIANARLEFEGGGVANLTASRISLERMRKIRFFQRSGYISLDLANGRGAFLRLRPGIDLSDGPVTASSLEGIVERIPLRGDGVEPLRRELDSFVTAVRRDGGVTVSGEDGRAALAVALEIVERIDYQNVADRITA